MHSQDGNPNLFKLLKNKIKKNLILKPDMVYGIVDIFEFVDSYV